MVQILGVSLRLLVQATHLEQTNEFQKTRVASLGVQFTTRILILRAHETPTYPIHGYRGRRTCRAHLAHGNAHALAEIANLAGT